MTNLPYIANPKVFEVREEKLNRVLRVSKEAMKDVGLEWNERKYNVVHITKGTEAQDAPGFKAGEEKRREEILKGKQMSVISSSLTVTRVLA